MDCLLNQFLTNNKITRNTSLEITNSWKYRSNKYLKIMVSFQPLVISILTSTKMNWYAFWDIMELGKPLWLIWSLVWTENSKVRLNLNFWIMKRWDSKLIRETLELAYLLMISFSVTIWQLFKILKWFIVFNYCFF